MDKKMSQHNAKYVQLIRLLAELGYAEDGTVLVYQADAGELIEYWTEDRIADYLGHTPGTSSTRIWCLKHGVARKRFSPLSLASEVVRAKEDELGRGYRHDLD